VHRKRGYNIQLTGRPGAEIRVLPPPDALQLPLRTSRFHFDQICVKDAQRVDTAAVLAKDPANFSILLLSPQPATARLSKITGHIVLEDLAPAARTNHYPQPEENSRHAKCEKLVTLGAWQFFYDAHTNALPDPYAPPQAVIVSTVSCEPYVARADVQLQQKLESFMSGLKQLHSLLDYQPIYLVLPDFESALALQIRRQLRGYAYINIVEIPLFYPRDNFTILARQLGLKEANGPVWALHTEGVLAVDQALTAARPCTTKFISIAGPAVDSPHPRRRTLRLSAGQNSANVCHLPRRADYKRAGTNRHRRRAGPKRHRLRVQRPYNPAQNAATRNALLRPPGLEPPLVRKILLRKRAKKQIQRKTHARPSRRKTRLRCLRLLPGRLPSRYYASGHSQALIQRRHRRRPALPCGFVCGLRPVFVCLPLENRTRRPNNRRKR